MNETHGFCLVSQQIRKKIQKREILIPEVDLSLDEKGLFKDSSLENRVQPSSFEPTLGNEIFILDVEDQTVFTPGLFKTVYRALLQLPIRQRQKASMEGGFELKRGFNYLIPLEERVIIEKGERIKSSPKSSTGRLFPIVRMVADYSPCFDEIHSKNSGENILQLWLLVQPTSFNLIFYPGLTLNQLRFFRGTNVSLNQQELIDEFDKCPMLYNRESDGSFTPDNPIITDDGMQINLDLTGRYTEGIVALRARSNPIAIDLTKTRIYEAEDFFEPVENIDGNIRLKCGERYLIASKGVLYVPPHLSAELRRYYGVGIRGIWDEAGFVDNGFRGDLVFEVTPTESGGMVLKSDTERPASVLEFFRTGEIPDKTYGEQIGSNYQEQLGSKVSKHFKRFDFKYAARDYKKLKRDVLVQDAHELLRFRLAREGFEPVRLATIDKLLEEIEKRGFFHSRYDCERDDSILQVIPYTLLFKGDKIFTYVRATNIQDYGDIRLFGKHSIGLGGHIIKNDGPDFIKSCITREVTQEEVEIIGDYSEPKLVGTLMAYDTPVDRVHFGLIYAIHTSGTVRAKESSITSFGMKSFEELIKNPKLFETWSRILIPYLGLLDKV